MRKISLIIFSFTMLLGASVLPSSAAFAQNLNYPIAKCSLGQHLMPDAIVNIWALGGSTKAEAIKDLKGLNVKDRKTKILMNELISSIRTGGVEPSLVDEIESRMRRGYC